MPTSTPDRYAVMGNPIAHSKSPRIHALFAAQTGQAMVYDKLLVELDAFPQAVAEFTAAGGKGLNITVPFKEQAWALANVRSPRAERAGAVNTLRIDGPGRYFGDNTDGAGLVRDLTQNLGVTLGGKRILILGAGGAVRGILAPFLAENPAGLVIANRTADKAAALAREFVSLGEVHGQGFNALPGSFDIIVNGTAASLQGDVPPIAPACVAGAQCYDMMYGAQPTAFLRWCQRHGASGAHDGLGMLVEQAAEAFNIWRGVRPDTAPVIAALRQA